MTISTLSTLALVLQLLHGPLLPIVFDYRTNRPNEAYQRGWSSLRWITAINSIVVGYFGTGLRLRKASILRNHQSPVDFITDRYQSQVLRYTVLVLQLFPSIIYLAAQVVAIQVTFNSIFELDPDEAYPVIIIMAMILIFEWVGGLNSVALTDLFQAVVMVLSFIILPVVVLKNFGGWKDLDPETYPRPQSYQTLSKVSGTSCVTSTTDRSRPTWVSQFQLYSYPTSSCSIAIALLNAGDPVGFLAIQFAQFRFFYIATLYATHICCQRFEIPTCRIHRHGLGPLVHLVRWSIPWNGGRGDVS